MSAAILHNFVWNKTVFAKEMEIEGNISFLIRHNENKRFPDFMRDAALRSCAGGQRFYTDTSEIFELR